MSDPLQEPVVTREHALGVLGALWDADTDIGRRLLGDLVAQIGYAAALTDKALLALAQMQQREEEHQIFIAERRRIIAEHRRRET